jgi:hypothetical protein
MNDTELMSRGEKQLMESLKHVYWIGGGAAAGKSTISRRLCEEFGFTRWAGDGRWIEHWQTATREKNPVAFHIEETLRSGGSFNWFLGRRGEEIAHDYVTMARVEFEDAVDELRRVPRDVPIVVDAFLGFPELVLKVAEPRKAVFLISTDDFSFRTWKHRTTEGSPGLMPILRKQLDGCSDPQFALDSFIESNYILSRFVANDCRREGGRLIVTGGCIGIEEAYAAVKKHFRLD